jgi:hypothetical protein
LFNISFNSGNKRFWLCREITDFKLEHFSLDPHLDGTTTTSISGKVLKSRLRKTRFIYQRRVKSGAVSPK